MNLIEEALKYATEKLYGEKLMIVVVALAASLLPAVADSEFSGGLWKEIVYDQPNDLPVVFGGESCCESAQAEQYCVYLDLWYDDGTPVWARRADWRLGTHDWEKTVGAFVPTRPVKKIRMHAFLRSGTGSAKFRNLWLERREGTGDVVQVRERWNRPFGQGTDRSADEFWGERQRLVTRRSPLTTVRAPKALRRTVSPSGRRMPRARSRR